jgi:Protein of unknown function (DUF1194)
MSRASRLFFAAIVAAIGLRAGTTLAAEPVDLLLVLAADVSRSIDAPKFKLQRDGYAAALTDRRVLDVIRSGPNHRIAVCFVEWSGIGEQKVVVDWTAIGDDASAKAFSSLIAEAQRSFADRTSIGGGIAFSMMELELAPFEARRRIIDLSGDGANNVGREVTAARDEALAQGVTINGVVILSERPLAWNADHTNPPGGLDKYYRDNVVGGPGSFVMVAENFESFGQAIINKLTAEIAATPSPRREALNR